eukprot:jgi/Botrbrau1/3413/Bobra.0337s0046.1
MERRVGSASLDLRGAESGDLPVVAVTEPGPPSAKRLSAGGENRAPSNAVPTSPVGPRESRPYSHRSLDYGPSKQSPVSVLMPDGVDTSKSSDLSSGTEPAVEVGQQESEVELLEPIPIHRRVTIEYRHVNAWVAAFVAQSGLFPGVHLPSLDLAKIGRKLCGKSVEQDSRDLLENGGSTFSKPSKDRRILYNVTGCCHAGEVLALMGPSGSGKTTLLSIIGQRAQKHMRRNGEVLFNGHSLNKRMKRQIGYVMQDDLLYESLTVWEVLYYAAMLRLPRNMSIQEKKDRVLTVIKALGIMSCKDTIIGGFFRKGISGGERKRVSIGHELLINPSVLLLDEPTSGLDSTTAMHVLDILRQLATGGRAVVTTIHQPSSRLYQTLDKLLLLSQGHALYYGPAQEADAFFSSLGYRLPYRVNIADFILDLASSDVALGKRSGEESRQFLIECSERYLQQFQTDGYGVGPDENRLLAQIREDVEAGRSPPVESISAAANASKAARVRPVDVEAPTRHGDLKASLANPGASEHRWGATYPTQIRILFMRAVRVRRFQTLSTQDLAQFVIVGLLTGCFWWQRASGDNLAAASDTLGLLFFELLFLSFRTMFTALFTFPDEFKMLLKERASGMYRLSAFYFARTASDLPMDFAIPTVFLVIIYFMGGLRRSASAFFENFFTVILVALVAQGLGLLLGTSVMNPKTAQTIASILVLTMVLVGGYFVRGIPSWISWLKYLSFIFYGWGLLVHIEYTGRTIYSCINPQSSIEGQPVQMNVRDHPEQSPICRPVNSVQVALGLQQDPNSQKWVAINACVLIAWLIFFRVCVYIALRIKTNRV